MEMASIIDLRCRPGSASPGKSYGEDNKASHAEREKLRRWRHRLKRETRLGPAAIKIVTCRSRHCCARRSTMFSILRNISFVFNADFSCRSERMRGIQYLFIPFELI